MSETYFDILDLPPTSDFGQIDSAYHRKKNEFRDNPAKLIYIERAYKVLINPISLKNYLKDPKPIEYLDASFKEAHLPDDSRGISDISRQPDSSSGSPRRRTPTNILDQDRPVISHRVNPNPGSSKSGRQRTILYEPEQIDDRSTNAKNGSSSERIGFSEEPQNIGLAYVEYYFANNQTNIPLSNKISVIGRPPAKGEPPDIPLPDPEQFISRRHALICLEDDIYVLQDMGSDNGTYLNGIRLQASIKYPLKDGDIIEIEKRKLTLHLPSHT